MHDTGPLAEACDGLVSQNALRNLCLANPFFRARYEGWDEVGQGGYATVVKTHCVDRGEIVALKVFHCGGDEEDRRRFKAEVLNAQRIHSPLLVRTYSPFDQGGLRWIEMEYVDGSNLDDELRRREAAQEPFSVAEALDIASCITQALALAHREQVVHRDLKPANVLLPRSREPLAKLADFGISRFAGGDKLTSTGAFAGTPKFGSPEAFAGDPLGPPHDVYSLGLCLYLLFTNNHFPFSLPDGYTLPSLMAVHTRRAPVPARAVRPEICQRLEVLLGRCLEKKPSKRPTAGVVLAELEAIRSGLSPVRAPRPDRGSRTRWGLAAAGLALAAVGTLGWSLAVGGLATEASTPAPLSAASAAERTEGRPSIKAEVSGAFLVLRNDSNALLDHVAVELATPDGQVFKSRVAESFAAGETAYLPLDSFQPSAEGQREFNNVRVSGRGQDGLFALSVPAR